jgi:1,4-alpha-glucan branching enzyme
MRQLVRECNALRTVTLALRSETLQITHVDQNNQVLAFKRWTNNGQAIITVVNLGDNSFGSSNYGVYTGGQPGRFKELLCSQDARFGGWDGSGNANRDLWTQTDGRVYINLPKYSVVVLVLQT